MLHRWIRTGQVRCNGKRCKAFSRVEEGDMVRLPPFAQDMCTSLNVQAPQSALPPLPDMVHASPQLLVFNKPAGLPVHPGTGHADSLSSRLAAHYSDAPFCPTPAHRLDKDTSGLLLVACTYSSLRMLQDAFASHNLVKEYLAWVDGTWPLFVDGTWPLPVGGTWPLPVDGTRPPQLLRDQLIKSYTGSHEKMAVLQKHDDTTPVASCLVRCLCQQEDRSLMHIRLLTGKTHQIRVQLASRGHPLCGDVKYGSQRRPPFKLHAMRLILPDDSTFEVLPPWHSSGWSVAELPAVMRKI